MMAAMSHQNQGTRLKDLLSDFMVVDLVPDIIVTGIQTDSRQVTAGNVFVALSGEKEHGLAYAHEALKRGAVAVLCDSRFDQYCQQLLTQLMTRVICIPVKNLQMHLGEIVSHFYGHPSGDMFVVGVTGTDGKTSVSNFVAQALDEVKNPCAVIGTIGNGRINQLVESTHTTPDVVKVHQLFSEFQAMSISQVAMEVSSHGLDQGRVNAVDFNVAVFTNLGRDHLDYHGDLESYKQSKRKLFFMPGLDAAVINLDDEFGRQLIEELKDKLEVWAYSRNPQADCPQNVHLLQAKNIMVNSQGLNFVVTSEKGEACVSSTLIGDFNISNMLAVLAVLQIKGMLFADAIKRLEKLSTVPGRVETIRKDNQSLVVIDYAHTPLALASVLNTLRSVATAKLYCVFGCGGDRDRGKRALMAEAAEQYADYIVLTDDNPRTENPDQIIEQIKQGFKDLSKVHVIRDRKQAIEYALQKAEAMDLVLIAGKGHENYQLVGHEKLPFSDHQVVEDFSGDVK